MSEPLVLAIDYGTQSVRAILFNQKGESQGKKKLAFEPPYFSLQPGWAEQYPEFYWDKLCEVTNALKAEVGDKWNDIAGVVSTTIRDTNVIIDKDKKVIRPIILWLDGREIASEGGRVPKPIAFALRLINMYQTANKQSMRCAANWISENEPENWAKTDKFLLFSGFINLKLTGEVKDSVASQIGHIPFDYRNHKWLSAKAFNSLLFDCKPKYMPELVDSGKVMGKISAEASKATGIPEGIPVIAAGSDKGCETVGVGCIDDETASVSFGTTSTIQLTLDKYVEPLPFCPPYPALLPKHYNPEFEIFRGYWMLTWYKEQFGKEECDEAAKLGIAPEQLLCKKIRDIPAGSEGLILQPYWTPGLNHPDARGAIIGWTDTHTKYHLYKAIIEGIAYGLLDGLEKLEQRADTRVKVIRVSGGGAQNDEHCQITANVLGLPVEKVQTYETSALGAAMAGFTGLGIYASIADASKAMTKVIKRYEPDMKEHAYYKDMFDNVYEQIYVANRVTYKTIKRIQEEYYGN